MINIYINDFRGIPAPRPRVTKFGTYNDRIYTDYKEFLQWKLSGFNMLSNTDIAVDVEFGYIPAKSSKKNKYPVPKYDIDNLTKGILDAMNGVLFEDDVLVTQLTAKKCYADQDYLKISIREL